MKGYSYNTFNDQSEIMFMNKDTIDEDGEAFQNMLNLGWKVYASNEHVVKLKNKTPKATWQQGFFAILDSGKKGFSKYVKPREVSAARNDLIKRAQWMRGIDVNGDFAIYDGGLGDTQKRFVMDKSEMATHLDLEQRISHVLGNTTSRLFRKNKSAELNAQLVNILAEDYKAASDYDKAKKFDSVIIEPVKDDYEVGDEYDARMKEYLGQNPRMLEISKLLPTGIKANVKDTLFVRKRVTDIIFGHRELVPEISETGFIGEAIQKTLSKKSLATVNKVARIADYQWKNFVKFNKERIVVLNPQTHFGNFMSNTNLLIMAGVPISDIIGRHKQSYRALEDYRSDTESWIRAQAKVDAGDRSAQKDVDKYKTKMETNPVNDSITNGLFSFIVEDVANELTVERNSVKEMFGKAIRGSVEVGMRQFNLESSKDADAAMKRAYVDIDTQEGIEMMKLFQYSDFIAKDTLYHYKLDKGMTKADALQEANDMFIDYRYNDSAFLEYLNATAIFPFSKFAIRIQPILLKLAVERPVSLAVSILMNGYVLDDTVIAGNFVYDTHFGVDMMHGFGSGVDPSDVLMNPFVESFM